MTRSWHFGDWMLCGATRTLRRADQTVSLQPKVCDLLLYLVEHRERVINHDELLDHVWKGTLVGSAALARAIKEARKAVGDDGDRQAIIATVHSRGYRFVAEVSERYLGGFSHQMTEAVDQLSTLHAAPTGAESLRATIAPGIVWVFPEAAPARGWPLAGSCSLGRGPDCYVQLSTANVSRVHAQLMRDGPIFVLRDCGSTNGTFVNGVRIHQCAVSPGDVIRLGDALGVVMHDANALPSASSGAPLATRRQDVAALFRELLAQNANGQRVEVTVGLLESLLIYDWPGGTGELSKLSEDMLLRHPPPVEWHTGHLPSWLLHAIRDLTVSSSPGSIR